MMMGDALVVHFKNAFGNKSFKVNQQRKRRQLHAGFTQENCKLKVAEVVRLRSPAKTPRILTNSATGKQPMPTLQFSWANDGGLRS